MNMQTTDHVTMYLAICIALLFAMTVIWSVVTIQRLKSYLNIRDTIYMSRINGFEEFMKEEFKELFKAIKKS